MAGIRFSFASGEGSPFHVSLHSQALAVEQKEHGRVSGSSGTAGALQDFGHPLLAAALHLLAFCLFLEVTP